MRPELAALAPHVKRWQQRYPAGAEHGPAELRESPDLGPIFEFQSSGAPQPGLSSIHCFNYAAMLSHGKVSGDIPAVSTGAQRLATGIAERFFQEDIALHYRDMENYDVAELQGDEWTDADARCNTPYDPIYPIDTDTMSNDDLSLDIFYGISSPWAYMGAERAYRIVEQHGVPVRLRSIRIIQGNGGIPLNQRPDARQRYHATELRRWSRRLDIALHVTPRFYPCRTIETAAQAVIAATRAGLDARAFSFAIQRALWADVATLREIAAATLGAGSVELVREMQDAGVVAEWEQNLADAQELGIFGKPTYVVRGELFWGQDHLDFVEEALGLARLR